MSKRLNYGFKGTIAATVKHIAAQPGSHCGLDKNIHGVYTLGCYGSAAPGAKPWNAPYYQLQRKTQRSIQNLAVRLGFETITDRT